MSIIADLLERHAREIPLWGHLPAAMRLKESAVQELGVEAAFAQLRGVLAVPGLDRLRRLPVLPMAMAARQRGAMKLELWAGGECFLRPRPTTRLASPPKPMPGRSRGAWLACFESARVRGRSSLLQLGDALLHDIEAGEGGFPDHPAYDPGVLAMDQAGAWMMEADEPAFHVRDAFWLGGSHAVDFGHWMVEYLPKLMIAQRAGLPDGTTILVDQLIPATIREALPRWIPAGSCIREVPHLAQVSVGRLWCAPAPQYPGFYPLDWSDATWECRSTEPASMAGLLRCLRDGLGEALARPTGVPRVYFARKPERGKKRLLNQDVIEAIAQAQGFSIVHPEDHPLVEQVRLAAHATHILAPEGSNNLLSFFASVGARVATLSPPSTYPLGDVGAILAALGVDFEIVVGPDEPTAADFCPFWNDYRIDAGAFAAWLRDWA